VFRNENAFRQTLERLTTCRSSAMSAGMATLRHRAGQGQETKQTLDAAESERVRGYVSRVVRGHSRASDDRGDPVVQVAPPPIRLAEFDRDGAEAAAGAVDGPDEDIWRRHALSA
jgi:hypothetical protein